MSYKAELSGICTLLVFFINTGRNLGLFTSHKAKMSHFKRRALKRSPDSISKMEEKAARKECWENVGNAVWKSAWLKLERFKRDSTLYHFYSFF